MENLKMSKTAAATKQAFADAFCRLYCNENIEQISVKKIADTAGYYRSTFYNYFADIYELQEYCQDLLLQRAQQILNENVHIWENDEGLEIAGFIKKVTVFYIEQGENLNLFLNKQGAPQFENKIKNIIKPLILEHLSLDDTDSNEFNVIFEFTVSGMLSAYKYWYANKETLPVEDFLQYLQALLAMGPLARLKNLM